MGKLAYVNLGCGSHFHQDWTNIDFVSTGEGVIAHNLVKGIPLGNESMKVAYHSHVLEHFTKLQAEQFLQECFRILKPQGIIRIAVPDLERIISTYMSITQRIRDNAQDEMAWADYDWILLEMYDQTVRNATGGEMAKYLFQNEISNIDFVYKRIGYEGRNMRENFLKMIADKKPETEQKEILIQATLFDKLRHVVKYPRKFFKHKLKNWLFKEEIQYFEENAPLIALAKFRLGGEIHQWMYDKYSLKRLLEKYGFTNVEEKDAFESNIPNWDSFGLDVKEGKPRKPDSLFIEAVK